jgi:hypothetical protein
VCIEKKLPLVRFNFSHDLTRDSPVKERDQLKVVQVGSTVLFLEKLFDVFGPVRLHLCTQVISPFPSFIAELLLEAVNHGDVGVAHLGTTLCCP